MTPHTSQQSIVDGTVTRPEQGVSSGALAHDAYWLVHYDVTGALKGSRRAADRIVAASILAELVEIHAIEVEPDRMVVCKRVPVADRLLASVCDQLVEAPRLSPVDVIDALASDIRGRVAERLVTSGFAVKRRSGFRRVTVRRDGDLAPASVEADLINSVASGHRLTDQQWFLLTLLRHAGGEGFLLGSFSSVTARRAFAPDMVKRDFAGEKTAGVRYGRLAEAAYISLRSTAGA